MDLLITLAVIGLLSLPVALAGAWMSERGRSAWAIYVRGHQEDPWPVGVQEEYPDHHWAIWSDEAAGQPSQAQDRPVIEEDPPAVPIAPVRSSVRRLT
jgi:hypothetical protein